MSFADWPVNRIRWLWLGVMLYVAGLIFFLAVRQASNQQARPQDRLAGVWHRDTPPEPPLSPGAKAQGDSLMDSLGAAFREYMRSPEGQRTADNLIGVFEDVSATTRRVVLLFLAIALSPVVIAAVITLAWYRARRAP